MSPRERLLIVFAAVGAVLLGATVLVAVMKGRQPDRDLRELELRVRTWWLMIGVFFGALLWDDRAALGLWALICFLALKEFLSLVPFRHQARRLMFWCYLAIPLQFVWVSMAWYLLFIIFIPVYLFLALPVRAVMLGHTEDYVRTVATLQWGVMLLVFCLSHAAFLLVLPEHVNPVGGGAGLLVFLVVLTQLNDVLQYVWGKSIGNRKVAPSVSPGKTWGGLIGGVLSTTVVAGLLAPFLTSFSGWEGWGAGFVIGVAGFAGDVNLSALKRDIGVKDSGSLLPGHGGLLDRVDSLTFTAPLFFHYTVYLHKMFPELGG